MKKRIQSLPLIPPVTLAQFISEQIVNYKSSHDRIYMTPRLLLFPARNLVRRSSVYSRAASISLGSGTKIQ